MNQPKGRPALMSFGVEDELVKLTVIEPNGHQLDLRFTPPHARVLIDRVKACLYQIAAMKDEEISMHDLTPPANKKPEGWLPRAEQCCGNCDCGYPSDGPDMICRGAPPTPILIGMQQMPPTEEDKKMAMLGKPIQPRINAQVRGFHANVSPDHWCRAWTPRTEG